MMRLNVRQSLLALPMLALTLMTASPVAASSAAFSVEASVTAKTSVDLPMLCPAPKTANAVQIMVDIDSAFAHNAASWTSPVAGRIVKFQCFDVVGRNKTSEWLLVPYGNSQAWIHGSMVRFRGDLATLPLSDNVVTKTTLSTALPKGLPYIGVRSRWLYQQSVKSGKDPHIFTVMGDCNSEAPVYLGRFAAGGFDAASYPSLSAAVKWFTPSFTRTSLATHGSFNAAMAFDSTWSDPSQCRADEGPLGCELRVSKASILIIAVGTGDQYTWKNFDANYRAILDYTLNAGVLPVLMTKADALDSQDGGAPVDYINTDIRNLGREYGVPVIDFWLATRSLSNNGLIDERNNALQATNPFHLSEQGMDMRMLMTLQTLKAVINR